MTKLKNISIVLITLFIGFGIDSCNKKPSIDEKASVTKTIDDSTIIYESVEFNRREKIATNFNVDYLEYRNLCLKFLTDNENVYLSIRNNNKELCSWINTGFGLEAYIPQTFLFYSKEQNDYYVVLSLDVEEGAAFEVLHITDKGFKNLGVFNPNNDDVQKMFELFGYWIYDNYDFKLINGKPALNLLAVDNEVLVRFDQVDTSNIYEKLNESKQKRIENLDKSLSFINPYNIRKNLCFADEAWIDFEVKWKEKQIELKSPPIENWKDYIYFKSDTLVLETAHTFKPCFYQAISHYFTYSPRQGAIVLSKLIFHTESSPYHDDVCDFTEVYKGQDLNVHLESLTNEGLYKLVSERNRNYNRTFTLREIIYKFQGKFGPNETYFSGCTEVPSLQEMLEVLRNEPITSKNLDSYIEIIGYLQNTGKRLKDLKIFEQGYYPNDTYFCALHLAIYIAKKFPEKAILYKYMGDSYWELNQKDKAKDAYQKYVSLVKAQPNEKNTIPDYIKGRLK